MPHIRHSAVVAAWLLAVLPLAGCASAGADKAPMLAPLTTQERALLAKGDAARALARHDEAMEYYRQAAAASAGATRAHLELAALQRREGRLKEAETILAEAYALNPRSYSVLRDYAELALYNGDDALAARLAQEGLARLPGDVRLLNVRGVVLDRAGRHKEAQRHYARAMTHSHTEKEREAAANNRILSLIASGDYERAIRAAQTSLPRARDKPAMRRLLALAYGVRGEVDKAYDIGLQDLDIAQASENLRFYRQLRRGETPMRSLFMPAEESISPE